MGISGFPPLTAAKVEYGGSRRNVLDNQVEGIVDYSRSECASFNRYGCGIHKSDGCIEKHLSDGQPVAVCMIENQIECFGFEEGSAAGTMCFREVKDYCDDLIGEQMMAL